jgi:hypothetical protein
MDCEVLGLNLKVLFVNEKEKLPKQRLTINMKEHKEIQGYDYINGFHCFKITNEHSIDEKGIEIDEHEFINGPEFFEENNAKRLVSLGFLFVNAKNGNIYAFNYANHKIQKLMIAMFQLINIDTRVDHTKLQAITKIEVRLKNDPQMSWLSDNIPMNGFNLVRELGMQEKALETFTAKYEFKKTGIQFMKQNLSKVLGRYECLRIEGLDANNNIIKIRDGVQLEIKIDIPCDSFEKLNSLLLSTIVDKIAEKEGGSLRDY